MTEQRIPCQKCRSNTPEVFGSRWCSNCYYPGIDDDYEEYQSMLEEGYRQIDAAVQSGWRGAEEFYEDA